MTLAHPNGAARPARIRILGAAPPPPPPRRGPNRGLVLASVLVAAFGVGITLLVRPQISDDPSPTVMSGETIDLMGMLQCGARLPDARTLRVLRTDSPDFPSAARFAAARERVPEVSSDTSVPQAVSSSVGPPAAPTATNGSTPAAPTTTAPTTAGPDQPPDPASPNTSLDQS